MTRKRSEGSEGSKPSSLAPGLYVVATPIGNLADITLRGLDVLEAADVVACEDQRVSRTLLAAHGISAHCISYHEHNAPRMRPEIVRRIRDGAAVALISDAGTPLISDPGYKLVRALIDEGLPVTAVPGPCAPITALVLSGLPSDRFYFAGFLPSRDAARRRALEPLRDLDATLLFMEAARRLPELLAAMAEVLGPREAVVARELTKRFEELRRDSLDRLHAHYRSSGAPKGEVVVVVAPPAARAAVDDAEIDRRLAALLGTESLRDAARRVAEETGLPRRRVYARALALGGESAGP